MTINRYRLRHLKDRGHRGANRAYRLLLSGYPIEILQIQDNAVKTIKITPALRKIQE